MLQKGRRSWFDLSTVYLCPFSVQRPYCPPDPAKGMTISGREADIKGLLSRLEQKPYTWVAEQLPGSDGNYAVRLTWPSGPGYGDIGEITFIMQLAPAMGLTISDTSIVQIAPGIDRSSLSAHSSHSDP